MEVFNHNFKALFQQLGLPSEQSAITGFLAKYTLTDDQTLISATFWTTSQRQFLEEATLQDADWAEQVDTLDTLLRKA